MGRFINADAFVTTGQGIIGNNMFAYCLNNPISIADPSGSFGILTGVALAGIGISAMVGGIVAGISTAMSGGSVGEILTSSAIGVVTAGGIATVAAIGAVSGVATGTVMLMSAGVGAAGEIAAIAAEHAFHKNDHGYTFDWGAACARVTYAAGIGSLSGGISLGLNSIFTGADEVIGTAISAEVAISLGAVDFGARQLLSTELQSVANTTTATYAGMPNMRYGACIAN